MYFIVFAGLPCTGKSTVADAVGRQLGVPVFAKDWLEAALRRSELEARPPSTKGTGDAGYELLTTLADHQLQLGQSVILDSVASTASIRATWQRLVEQYGATWHVVECICSDAATHRARITARERGIPGWSEPRWPDVERIAGYYRPWLEPRLVLDALDPLAVNIDKAVAIHLSDHR